MASLDIDINENERQATAVGQTKAGKGWQRVGDGGWSREAAAATGVLAACHVPEKHCPK